jgi:predicted site-specific integrase-resolvase
MITIQGTKFYNIEETAKLLGISSRTLSRWTSERENPEDTPKHVGILRAVTAPNGKKLFREQDILKAVSECLAMEISVDSLDDLPQLANA